MYDTIIHNAIVLKSQWDLLCKISITKEEARALGWSEGKNLAHFAPGKMIGGDEYKNKPPKLPQKEGRVWYECDVDYEINKRNSNRLYYSNDGLIFYSPDHGTSTFYYVN